MSSLFIPVVKRDHNMFGRTPSIASMSIIHIDPAIHLLSAKHGMVPHLGACISPVIVWNMHYANCIVLVWTSHPHSIHSLYQLRTSSGTRHQEQYSLRIVYLIHNYLTQKKSNDTYQESSKWKLQLPKHWPSYPCPGHLPFFFLLS